MPKKNKHLQLRTNRQSPCHSPGCVSLFVRRPLFEKPKFRVNAPNSLLSEMSIPIQHGVVFQLANVNARGGVFQPPRIAPWNQ